MIAAATSTPLPDVWRMPPGMIARYARKLRSIAAIKNPFLALGAKDEPASDPEQIRAILAGVGLYRKK